MPEAVLKAQNLPMLHEQPLMPRDWIQRRLGRMVVKGTRGGAFRPVCTLSDVAKWFDCSVAHIYQMESGRLKINDAWQVQFSQFFYLFDMGLITLKVDSKNRHKSWVRSVPPSASCKVPMPRVDFLATKIRFD